MKKLNLITSILIFLLIASTAFCTGQKEKANLTIWIDSSWGDNTRSLWNEGVAKNFMTQNPNIAVEVAQQANIYDTTRTALSGGAGPDLVMTYGAYTLELAKANFLYPLAEYISKYKWDKRFAPWSLNLYVLDDKTFALPDEMETLVLYYNKTLFEQKGWNPPKNIDELVSLARKISASGVIPFAHANAEWRPANEWYIGEFLNHVAGPQKVYEALTGKRSWTDPDFVSSIAILSDMQKNGWFMGALEKYYTTTYAQTTAALGQGKAAMDIEGTWRIGDLLTNFGPKAGNNNEWSWVPMPSKTGEAIFDVGIGNTLAINQKSASPNAVAQILDFYFSSMSQGNFLATYKKAPAPVRIKKEDLKGVDPRHVEILGDLDKAFAANNYGYTTWVFWGSKSENYLYEEIEKVWAGKETAEQYLEGLQKIMADERTKGELPPIPKR